LRVSRLSFFLASLVWNLGLGMTWLLVPLYAASQGLSNAQIGTLFSVPILAQASLNLLGGAYTDRLGGRRIMLASCWIVALSGLWFMVAEGFWMLLAGQVGLVLSRAAFWPATWAMASQLSESRGVDFGRLNAITNLGQIAGGVVCGFLLAATSFDITFAALAATGLMAFFAGLATRGSEPKPATPGRNVLAAYGPLLRHRIIQYSVFCAYVSALPFSLSMSFYPLLLARYGYGEEVSGILVSLRAVGAIGAGLIVARFVRTGPDTLWPVVCSVAVAAGVGLMPAINHVVPIGLWMLIVGLGSGAMTLYFQIIIAEASRPEERGAALALGGMGWSVSHLSTPLIMGFLADRYGTVHAFYALGTLGLLLAALIAWMQRWAFRRP
jgi:MFS family permease